MIQHMGLREFCRGPMYFLETAYIAKLKFLWTPIPFQFMKLKGGTFNCLRKDLLDLMKGVEAIPGLSNRGLSGQPDILHRILFRRMRRKLQQVHPAVRLSTIPIHSLEIGFDGI